MSIHTISSQVIYHASFPSLLLNLLTQLSSLLYSTYVSLHRTLLQTRLAELDTLDDFIANTMQFKSFAKVVGKIIDVVTKSDEEVSCQRRTDMFTSYNDTGRLFRNQVDELTTAELGDSQQRKTTISTMMVDKLEPKLELEILEVRFEHTYYRSPLK